MGKKKFTDRIKGIFRKAAKDVSDDAREVADEFIVPSAKSASKFGKNRFVSTAAGAKVGALVGVYLGPWGIAKGAAVGGFIGAVAGPTAVEKMERWTGLDKIKPKKKESNGNDFEPPPPPHNDNSQEDRNEPPKPSGPSKGPRL